MIRRYVPEWIFSFSLKGALLVAAASANAQMRFDDPTFKKPDVVKCHEVLSKWPPFPAAFQDNLRSSANLDHFSKFTSEVFFNPVAVPDNLKQQINAAGGITVNSFFGYFLIPNAASIIQHCPNTVSSRIAALVAEYPRPGSLACEMRRDLKDCHETIKWFLDKGRAQRNVDIENALRATPSRSPSPSRPADTSALRNSEEAALGSAVEGDPSPNTEVICEDVGITRKKMSLGLCRLAGGKPTFTVERPPPRSVPRAQ